MAQLLFLLFIPRSIFGLGFRLVILWSTAFIIQALLEELQQRLFYPVVFGIILPTVRNAAILGLTIDPSGILAAIQ